MNNNLNNEWKDTVNKLRDLADKVEQGQMRSVCVEYDELVKGDACKTGNFSQCVNPEDYVKDDNKDTCCKDSETNKLGCCNCQCDNKDEGDTATTASVPTDVEKPAIENCTINSGDDDDGKREEVFRSMQDALETAIARCKAGERVQISLNIHYPSGDENGDISDEEEHDCDNCESECGKQECCEECDAPLPVIMDKLELIERALDKIHNRLFAPVPTGVLIPAEMEALSCDDIGFTKKQKKFIRKQFQKMTQRIIMRINRMDSRARINHENGNLMASHMNKSSTADIRGDIADLNKKIDKMKKNKKK